jgi:hypothetical protein
MLFIVDSMGSWKKAFNIARIDFMSLFVKGRSKSECVRVVSRVGTGIGADIIPNGA